MNIIQNIAYLVGSLFTTTTSLIAENPIYDKDFIDKFSTLEDKKKLNEAVKNLKDKNDSRPHTIELSNNQKVTIVVG